MDDDINDSGIISKFSRDYMNPERYEAIFGEEYADVLAVGDRVVTLDRHFNNQRGFDRGDDTLPYEDDLDGFEDALVEYYERRGWTGDGEVPTDALPV